MIGLGLITNLIKSSSLLAGAAAAYSHNGDTQCSGFRNGTLENKDEAILGAMFGASVGKYLFNDGKISSSLLIGTISAIGSSFLADELLKEEYVEVTYLTGVAGAIGDLIDVHITPTSP